MNIFYAEPEKVSNSHFMLEGQEAHHASKVLRLRTGDEIYATDGRGARFKGNVEGIGKHSVSASIIYKETVPKPVPEKVLAMGIIKKRDRMEFAIEKAVELGASEIVLFDSHHSEKNKIKADRLRIIMISAMKQSMRSWLPELGILKSLDEVLHNYGGHKILMAHEQTGFDTEKADSIAPPADKKLLLLVGPEGGFSDGEVELAKKHNAEMISLGKFRLRTETAAIAFLSRFL